MLYTKDVKYYMDYLQEKDEILCRKLHGRKPSLFYSIGFIKLDTKNNPQCITTTQRCARGNNLQYEVYLYTNPPRLAFYVCCYLNGTEEA
jgi:hypothetical protein